MYIECENQHSKLETCKGSFEPSTFVYVLATYYCIKLVKVYGLFQHNLLHEYLNSFILC